MKRFAIVLAIIAILFASPGFGQTASPTPSPAETRGGAAVEPSIPVVVETPGGPPPTKVAAEKPAEAGGGTFTGSDGQTTGFQGKPPIPTTESPTTTTVVVTKPTAPQGHGFVDHRILEEYGLKRQLNEMKGIDAAVQKKNAAQDEMLKEVSSQLNKLNETVFGPDGKGGLVSETSRAHQRIDSLREDVAAIGGRTLWAFIAFMALLFVLCVIGWRNGLRVR